MTDKKGMPRLIEIMKILRGPNGCPWDKEQSIQSLRPYIIEEAFETAEALDQFKKDDPESILELKTELGDLLLQVVFIGQMASEENIFNFDDIADTLSAKLVRRHPHVFGNDSVNNSAEVLTNWNLIKREKEERKHLLDGIPRSMPAVLLSQRYASRAASVGFDWDKWEDVTEKIEEERVELLEAIEQGDHAEIEHEFGDLLFAVINLGRKLDVDSEKALKLCAERFKQRFDKMEDIDPSFIEGGRPLDELEALWQRAKKDLKEK